MTWSFKFLYAFFILTSVLSGYIAINYQASEKFLKCSEELRGLTSLMHKSVINPAWSANVNKKTIDSTESVKAKEIKTLELQLAFLEKKWQTLDTEKTYTAVFSTIILILSILFCLVLLLRNGRKELGFQ